MSQAYRTTPDPTETGMPGGIPYIVGNEAAERFSYYGMKAILAVFMTKYLLDAQGNDAFKTPEEAKAWVHFFNAAAYFTPIIGAIIADVFFGKYFTIVTLSLLYCVGHGCLAVMDIAPSIGMDMQTWLAIGMVFIALGAGSIKPCVSAHVGDQFGSGNKGLLTQVFNWFYFSINIGAAASQILTPLLLEHVGPWLAFGLPGVLMAIATYAFWAGRHKFIHIPASGWKKFRDETFSPDGLRALFCLSPLFLIFIPMFWALFDQTSSAWVLQADKMDPTIFGVTLLPSQLQAANPLLILVGIPLFTYGVYPLMARFFNPTPLRKIGIGLFLTAISFAFSAWIELQIEAGGDNPPSIGLQLIPYVILTCGEIMVSIVCLEFAYTQSPPKMKSFVMGVYFLGVSFGNLFTSLVNVVLETTRGEDGSTYLDGANYYWFFTILMFITAIVYIFFARYIYKGRTYIQGEDQREQIHAEAEHGEFH